MRSSTPSLPGFLLLALLTAGLLLCFAGPFCSAAKATEGESEATVDKMMAELSDEQVRQLLIDELKKDIEEEEVDPQKMKGPAHFLARLLGIMTRGHDDNTDEVRALFGASTTMGPDLYRVFVKL
ncbi:MAG: hypothetical protein HKP52_04095 [Desulfofustis sp.]